MSVQNPTKPDALWAWVPGFDTLPRGPLAVVDVAAVVLSVIGLAGMALALIWQVLSRYVLSAPTVWSEELSLLLFVWVAMLGIAVAVRRGEHLTLDVASRMVSGRPLSARVLAIVVTALMLITLVIIAWSCLQLLGPANRQSLAGIQTGLGIAAKVSWIYAALPVGLGLAAVFSIERLILLLRGRITVLNADADQQVVQELEREDDIAADLPAPGALGKDI